MSGFEVAGVVLGSFPLLISALEHWRSAAEVAGLWWRVRREYMDCHSNVKYHEVIYKRNLQELLLPIVDDSETLVRLVNEPGGTDWSNIDLRERMCGRLEESYSLYIGIIQKMNETAEELREELSFDNVAVQSTLALNGTKKQRQPSSIQQQTKNPKHGLRTKRPKFTYEIFRVKFSLNAPKRKKLFDQLEDCNERLQKLLDTSNRISTLKAVGTSDTKNTSTQEKVLKKVWHKSRFLFEALQAAWQCPCQQKHLANLRLEHRTRNDICFELILAFSAHKSLTTTLWKWNELLCGPMSCYKQLPPVKPSALVAPAPPKNARGKTVGFKETAQTVPKVESEPPVTPKNFKLCQSLADGDDVACIGIVSHGDEDYHLHPVKKRKSPEDDDPLTLEIILSGKLGWHLTRRQRYSIALLLASSVAQLQFTPWLEHDLTKRGILFFTEKEDSTISYSDPFISRDFPLHCPAFSSTDNNVGNFFSLGILLVELCFGQRIEDSPHRQKHPAHYGEAKQALDLVAALEWSQHVGDEAGDDYASAVQWCFMGANTADSSWRSGITQHVIRPLELCQKHFKTAVVP